MDLQPVGAGETTPVIDPAPSAVPLNDRQRRRILQQVVRENVDVREGRRRGLRRGRLQLTRWAMMVLPLPAAAAAGWLLLPPPPPPVEVTPRAAAVLAAASRPTARVAPEALVAARPSSLSATQLAGPADSLDRAVFPVGVRRIVIDPGHGGKDLGTVTSDGVPEKELTLDISRRLRDLLARRPGIEVLLTRERDQHVVLRDRAHFANEAKADLFVSVHLNWLQPASNRGVETFFLGPTQDPFLVQLTRRENQESGYSLADVRRLLDGIYLDLRQQESQQLAGAVQRSLYRALGERNPGIRDRGIKSAPFVVLVGTQMPAILAEVSCLSNRKEAELLATEPYRQAIAEALLGGIDSYTRELSRPTATGG
jgi:N-acetylmuramoyl-L-alanine amidase